MDLGILKEKFIKLQKKAINNEFNDTKGTSISMDWHMSLITHIASIIRPKTYVELGLYKCDLFNRMIPFCGDLIGVDISNEAGNYMIRSSKTKFLNMSTNEFAKELLRSPLSIDMLFIDADHSKEAVKEDFNSFLDFVSPHGIILLHDSHPGNFDQIDSSYCGDCYKAIFELSKNTNEYEMVTIPVPPGLTICRKRKYQLKWEELGLSSK